MQKYILLFSSLLMLTSCVQYRDLLSYHEPPRFPMEPQEITNFRPMEIQPNDILQISVSSLLPEAAAPFNGSSDGGYLVDNQGMVTLPTVGDIEVGNLTLEAAKRAVQSKLNPFFSEPPIVNIRLMNFKVNVNGEVGSPTTFTIANDRITIIEAITRAGDFTPYSQRDSILVIREFNNERTFGYIDFTSPEVFDSPYFYLRQNDVIYVRPQKTKVTTVRDPITRVLPYISIGTGLAALIITFSRLQ